MAVLVSVKTNSIIACDSLNGDRVFLALLLLLVFLRGDGACVLFSDRHSDISFRAGTWTLAPTPGVWFINGTEIFRRWPLLKMKIHPNAANVKVPSFFSS